MRNCNVGSINWNGALNKSWWFQVPRSQELALDLLPSSSSPSLTRLTSGGIAPNANLLAHIQEQAKQPQPAEHLASSLLKQLPSGQLWLFEFLIFFQNERHSNLPFQWVWLAGLSHHRLHGLNCCPRQVTGQPSLKQSQPRCQSYGGARKSSQQFLTLTHRSKTHHPSQTYNLLPNEKYPS